MRRVLVLCALLGCTPARAPERAPAYVGSAACKTCHASVYERWQKTRMANVVRDPRVVPDAITPDLSIPNPLVTFKREDIAFVYGSKWKQRYFTRIGDDYYPEPAQWDVTHQTWRKYFVADNTDWWVPFYPADNMKRPTGPLCDGCHSVNYDIRTHQVSEWNVGCEKCHGPGGEHARRPTKANIVSSRANDVCLQCHSQGRPAAGLIAGRAYDWPVGFVVGKTLSDYWRLDEPEGKASFTHFADGTAHKNRMQGNDFAQSTMAARGVTCASCHDVHGTANNADLVAPPSQVCFKCHVLGSSPHEATIEAHTHHAANSAGSDCLACHMPKIEQTIADVNVRAHTFRFVTPGTTEQLGVPNPCTTCHKDKSTAWASAQLATWH